MGPLSCTRNSSSSWVIWFLFYFLKFKESPVGEADSEGNDSKAGTWPPEVLIPGHSLTR